MPNCITASHKVRSRGQPTGPTESNKETCQPQGAGCWHGGVEQTQPNKQTVCSVTEQVMNTAAHTCAALGDFSSY